MKKFLLTALIIPIAAFSQGRVGVNTYEPQGTFHVDANRDNSSPVPTVTEALNDFVVKSDGKVGIGTINPTNILTIIGQNNADIDVGMFSGTSTINSIAYHNTMIGGTPVAPALVGYNRSIAAFEGYAYTTLGQIPSGGSGVGLMGSLIIRTGRTGGGELWLGTSPADAGGYYYNSSFDKNGNMAIGIDPMIRTAKTKLEVNGVISSTPQTLSAYGSNIMSTVVSVNPANNDDVFNLPDPALSPGAIIFVRNISSNNTAQIITPTGSIINASNVGGASNFYMVGLDNNSAKTKTVMFVSDGFNWTAFKPGN
jgi:hypothetical protein